MENRPELAALLERLQLLERRQHHWSRLALVLAAVSLLAFVGWAPFDKVKPPATTRSPEATAPIPTPDATQPVPKHETSPVAPEAAPVSSELTPSIAEVINGDDDPSESVLTDSPSDFQSYTHREGDEPFIPSRMDWVSLRACAELPRGGGPNDGYGIMYGPDGKGSNTIRVLCSYDSKRVNRKQMESDLKYIEMQLAGLAHLYGWDWLKVRIETRAVN